MARGAVVCDWDGTLVKDGEWLPGAIEALRALSRVASVVVDSCRAGWPAGRAEIRRTLDEAGFGFVPVWDGPGKPSADLYIDNQGLRLTDWASGLPAALELVRAAQASRFRPPKEAA